MRIQPAVAALALVAVSACASFEPEARELIPSPANFLIRIVPPTAVDRVSFAAYGDNVVLFAAHRGDDRYLLGTDLPSTLRARVDGRDCTGSIEMVSGAEYDGTLTIDGGSCALRLDATHPADAVDHRLEDDGPVAS
jgi:hypothetical protein